MILWEGPGFDGRPIVAILTGYEDLSRNRGTGPLAQVYILDRDHHPVEAVNTGADRSVCGTCPLRGRAEGDHVAGRACYVELAKAPAAVWRTYRAGGYLRFGDRSHDTLTGRAAFRAQVRAERRLWHVMATYGIRWGTYGDPSLIPLPIVAALAGRARVSAGYTHAWKTCDPRYAGFFMASVDTPAEYFEAVSRGWRTFRGGVEALPGEVLCPKSDGRSNCARCGLCNGRKGMDLRASIYIPPHGAGARKHPGLNVLI